MTPTEAIGLFCAGSLVTLVALLSLAWSRVRGFSAKLGGLQFVDRDGPELFGPEAVAKIARLEKERDQARQAMDQLEAALREVKGS